MRSPRFQDAAGQLRPIASLVAIAGFAALAFSVLVLSYSGKYTLFVKRPAEAVAIAMMVVATTFHPRSAVAKFLDWTPIVAVGLVSYSLYLWQPFIFRQGKLVTNLLILIGCALASYWLVERPFLRLKDRLGARRHGSVTSTGIVATSPSAVRA